MFKKQWQKVNYTYANSKFYFDLCPAGYSLVKTLAPIINKWAKGKVLDVGAGMLVHRKLLQDNCKQYVSLDIARNHPELDIVADAKSMPLNNDEFDTVLCSQVLEHDAQPEMIILEIFRVLKPGGIVIISVPHLSYIHGEPYDFFRFTQYGINYLLEKSGFVICKIISAGGLACLLLTIPSILFMTLFGTIPLIKYLALSLVVLINKVAYLIDSTSDKGKIFALNYIAVGQKPDE